MAGNEIIAFALVASFFMGLVIGSFLNVVIYRLPLIEESNNSHFSLIFPASHCVKCHQKLTILQNIPILSYLILHGKCKYCNGKISWQYPLIEFLTACLFTLIVLKYGVSVNALFLMIFTSFLIVLSTIDVQKYRLLDNLTLPLLWLGLCVNLGGFFTDTSSAVLGAIIGYLSFWIIYQCYFILRKKEVLGYGDFKLFAALGAWAGWQALPYIILLASLTGLLFGVLSILRGRGQKIAFGPHLALAGWVVLI